MHFFHVMESPSKYQYIQNKKNWKKFERTFWIRRYLSLSWRLEKYSHNKLVHIGCIVSHFSSAQDAINKNCGKEDNIMPNRKKHSYVSKSFKAKLRKKLKKKKIKIEKMNLQKIFLKDRRISLRCNNLWLL